MVNELIYVLPNFLHPYLLPDCPGMYAAFVFMRDVHASEKYILPPDVTSRLPELAGHSRRAKWFLAHGWQSGCRSRRRSTIEMTEMRSFRLLSSCITQFTANTLERRLMDTAILGGRLSSRLMARGKRKLNLNGLDKTNRRTRMKKVLLILTGTLLLVGAFAHADKATEQEVIKTIMDSNDYAKKNLKDQDDTVSKDGSLEFWSSGGFLQNVKAGDEPDEYESINIDAKHIHVITLVPGKVAVAQYYSEGAMARKNSAAVSNYRTRATQVYVKENGKWKIRAAHWSPIAGGSGTSQTAVD